MAQTGSGPKALPWFWPLPASSDTEDMMVIGEKRGKIKIVSRNGKNPNGYWVYTCICECGTTCHIPENRLILGYALFGDGCPTCKRSRKSIKKQDPIADTQEIINHTLQALYREYKGGAERRGIAWNLSPEDFSTMVRQPCHYCGAPASLKLTRRGIDTLVGGIDRMNSDQGYEQGNVVPCCKTCNRAKGTMPYKTFLEWIARVAEFQSKAYTTAGMKHPSIGQKCAIDASRT